MDTARSNKADSTINKMSLLAGGATFVPTFLLETGALTYLGYRMVEDLCEIYNIPFAEDKFTIGVRALGVAAITQAVSEGLDAAMEGSPTLHTIGNVLSSSIINSFVFITMGNVYKEHFEAGGTLDSLSLNAFLTNASNQFSFDKVMEAFKRSSRKDYSSLLAW